jgi:glycolate oxidase iron-sulfur subunit
MNKSVKSLSLAELLELVENEAHKCIRCGECRTVCPVFKEVPGERYTARGKIAIAQELAKGNLEFNGKVREAFDNCLLCTGCASQCSSGARADKVILAVRQTFVHKHGMSPVKKLLGLALSQSGKVLDIQAQIGSIVQPLFFRNVPEESGLHRRFAMPLVDEHQYVPVIDRESFRSRYTPVHPAENKQQSKVIFFTGCMSNYAMTEIADSVVKVLNALGISVEVPENQACCGMPMLANGDTKSVYKQLKKNIKALVNADTNIPIVTACASCGHMLKHGYNELMCNDSAMTAKIEALSSRTQDITEYLVQVIGEEKIKSVLRSQSCETVTYHDPCHLRKAQTISSEPRKLLKLLPGTTFVEMQSPEACCGLGGTYCISNMQLSKRIQSRKIEDAYSTGAGCISTSCPGCILQLKDGVRRGNQRDVTVKHVIQLLAETL